MIELFVIVSLLVFYLGLILTSELFELLKPKGSPKKKKISTIVVIRINSGSKSTIALCKMIRTVRRSAHVVLLDNKATSTSPIEYRSFVDGKKWIKYYRPKSSTSYEKALKTAINNFDSDNVIVIDSDMYFDKPKLKELFEASDQLREDEVIPISTLMDTDNQLESILIAVGASFRRAIVKLTLIVGRGGNRSLVCSVGIFPQKFIYSPALQQKVRSIHIIRSMNTSLSIRTSTNYFKEIIGFCVSVLVASYIVQILHTRQTTVFLTIWFIVAIGTVLVVLLDDHAKKRVKFHTAMMTLFLPIIVLSQLILPLRIANNRGNHGKI